MNFLVQIAFEYRSKGYYQPVLGPELGSLGAYDEDPRRKNDVAYCSAAFNVFLNVRLTLLPRVEWSSPEECV